jgi:hypothetical protein
MPDVLLLAFALPAQSQHTLALQPVLQVSILPRAEYAWLGNETESTAVQCGMFAAIVSFEAKLH